MPKRLTVEVDTVRRLVDEQFPQWAHLAVEKEHRWLPELAQQLRLPVPPLRGRGVPGAGYPYSWSIYGWLDGDQASLGRITDPTRFAGDIADFLVTLRRIDPADGPQPGIHNWYRGSTLRTFDRATRGSLAALIGHTDVDMATEIWNTAIAARWDGVDVWFHGDLAAGNLLLRNGQLAAVIDFGTCGVGDPSCDLAIAWTLLTSPDRQTFREQLDIDDATWARGRGWALWKTLGQYAGSLDDDSPNDPQQFVRVLNELFAEYSSQPV